MAVAASLQRHSPGSWFLRTLLFIVAAILYPAFAQSRQPTTRPIIDIAPQQPTLLAARLQNFMPQPAPITLRGATGQETLSLPISPRLRIERATLHLVATNSMSLLAPRSQLQIRLGQQVIAQIPLDAKLPQVLANIELPTRLLRPGYNELVFAVAQHYTVECEDPSAPELWTQIDTAQSWISLQGGLQPLQPTLSSLPDIFDPKLWEPHRLSIVAVHGIDPNVLRWGALASQAVALHLGYKPLQVRFARAGAPAAISPLDTPLRLDQARIPQGDAVLIGTADDLRPYLSPALATQITGPFLAVVPLDGPAQRYTIIVSGRVSQHIDTALRALTILNYPYPDAQSAIVQQIKLPALPNQPGPSMVYPNQSVSFAQLGFSTTNFSGIYGKRNLELTMPPDLFAPDNSMVRLHLRFSYGSGLRHDSVLNIFLNGRFQSAIALSSQNGGYFRDYEVAIPLTSFKPGKNTITFSATMMPAVSGKCVSINTDNLQLTLFDDSRVLMPNAASVAKLPDLNLLQSTGFPYTRKPYGADVVFSVSNADPDTAAAAWMLAAKLVQIQKLPLLDARWQIGSTGLGRSANAVIVGTASTLPKTIVDALPLRPGAVSQAPYPLQVSADGPGELGPLDRLWRWLAEKASLGPAMPVPTTVWTTQNGVGLGRRAALMQAALPSSKEGTLTVLLAAQANDLRQQTETLITPAIWSQLSGDLVLWRGSEDIEQQMVGPTYSVGQAGLSARLGFILSLHPWFWGVLIGLLSLLLAAVTLRLLMRFKHRRHRALPTTHNETPLV